MSLPPIRWGFLSTANIGRKNWRAVHLSGNGRVAAVASRNLDSARKFITECQAGSRFDPEPLAYGSYADLIASPDIDALYIPLPTGIRKEWILAAAAAGKPVLAEKPCALNSGDLQEIIAACRKSGVQFMDGVMFMHSPRLAALRAALDDGRTVGRLKRVSSSFSFRADPQFFTGNIRAHSTLEPFGCLGDLGWYCIRLTLWAAKGRLPRSVSGRVIAQLGRADSPAPVPTEFSGEMTFDDGLSASFYCSFVSELHQWAHLDGDKGSLRLTDFVVPPDRGELAYFANEQRVGIPAQGDPLADAQETRMVRTFAQLARGGTPSQFWPDLSLKTQQVLDACYQSALSGSRSIALE